LIAKLLIFIYEKWELRAWMFSIKTLLLYYTLARMRLSLLTSSLKHDKQWKYMRFCAFVSPHPPIRICFAWFPSDGKSYFRVLLMPLYSSIRWYATLFVAHINIITISQNWNWNEEQHVSSSLISFILTQIVWWALLFCLHQ